MTALVELFDKAECFIGVPSLREVRDALLFAHSDNLINDEELLLLYDLNTSSNLQLPYWSYDQFDLELLTDDECMSEFRFIKNDIYLLAEVFQVPDQVRCYNWVVVDGIEVLCIFLESECLQESNKIGK